jgi:hypothetical protein
MTRAQPSERSTPPWTPQRSARLYRHGRNGRAVGRDHRRRQFPGLGRTVGEDLEQRAKRGAVPSPEVERLKVLGLREVPPARRPLSRAPFRRPAVPDQQPRGPRLEQQRVAGPHGERARLHAHAVLPLDEPLDRDLCAERLGRFRTILGGGQSEGVI